MATFSIRSYRESDKSFVLATFLRGVYYGNSWYNLIPKDIFMEHYSKFAQMYVQNPNVKILIACLPDEPDVILGYTMLSADDETVHFCYVKAAFRKLGISKALLPKRPKFVTHLTELGKTLLNKYPTAVFNPFKL